MDNNPHNYMKWTDYWKQFPQFFPSANSASHFIQSRKQQLVEAGVLTEMVRGYLVNAPELDKILVNLIKGVKS